MNTTSTFVGALCRASAIATAAAVLPEHSTPRVREDTAIEGLNQLALVLLTLQHSPSVSRATETLPSRPKSTSGTHY